MVGLERRDLTILARPQHRRQHPPVQWSYNLGERAPPSAEGRVGNLGDYCEHVRSTVPAGSDLRCYNGEDSLQSRSMHGHADGSRACWKANCEAVIGKQFGKYILVYFYSRLSVRVLVGSVLGKKEGLGTIK